MLPDIPKNMPNMEILIREFETGFCSPSAKNSRDITSKSSISSDSNFVKKIVEAYESSVRASTDNENCQRERAKRKSDFFNTPDIAQNHTNVKKNSNLEIYDAPRLQCRNNFNKKSNVFLTPFETREIEDDFIILNRYHSESDEKTVSKIWSKASSKINMYGSMDESLINVQSSPLKKNESWNLKRRDQKSENKTNENKLMICSSPLEDVEDKNLDSEDFLDILTSSCDSSSNNSYRNLQADLYNFEDEQWQVELSSTSLSSLKSSESSHNNMLSMNNDDGSLILDSSFQDVTVTSSKDIPKNQKNLQNSESVPNLSFNQKSSPVIDASLNDDRPIKIDDDNYVTWMSALSEKLSGKKSLKKLLKSAFNTKLLLNYKKLWKKSAEKQSHERTSDSGFIERFLSSSSSSSQKSSSSSSWCSDLNHANEKPSTSLTFATFGRAKNACVSDKTCSKNSRMVLTEMLREKFTNNSEPSDLTTWSPLQHTTTSCKENHWNVESSLKSPILASSSKLKASCGYSPLPKHPYLTRNGIPKHPFVAKAKLETAEKESMEEEEEKEIRCDAKEHESDAHELETSDTSSVCQTELNLSFSRMSEWLTSSLNSDLLR